ncbi:hypothetical protein [Arthrobacter ruber]|uniref:hypothetical protein n=1 Tax=Arthrobacter ruber TaxID=1258893 RepID=UPI001F0C9324|nr:hypothetical protein [Arthrobacter ruber]
MMVSIPNALGALVLKGAAYMSDSRDPGRHLEDGAVLAATMTAPLSVVPELKGHDRNRIGALHKELINERHSAWLLLEPANRDTGLTAFRVLTANPQDFQLGGIRRK